MAPHELPEFARLLTNVFAYYRKDTSQFTLDLWWDACQPFAIEQVRKALTRHATDPERGVYEPKVADIVRVLQGTHTDRAALAWGAVLQGMSRVGAYQSVVIGDKASMAAVEDLGGWPKLCRTDQSELGYVQHRFIQAHKAYTERGDFQYPRLLHGDRSPDSEYEKKGLRPPPPVFIGDADTCLLILEGGTSGGKTAIDFAPLVVKMAEDTPGYKERTGASLLELAAQANKKAMDRT